MERMNELIDRYIATWNEPDAKRRRDGVRELWTSDGIHRSATIEARGHGELEARTAGTYDKWGKSGYVFRRVNDPDGHHDAVRFRWEMVPRDGGAAVAVATDIIILAPDGRIRLGYQFPDPAAPTT